MPLPPLSFIGDRNAPGPLSAVHARRPILGSGKVPEELAALASRRKLFIDAAGAREPEIRRELLRDGDREVWQIDVPVSPETMGARRGITMERERPEAIWGKIDQNIRFSSFRPDWTDALFVPRYTAAPHPPVMKRFDGRRVTPLWVFGNDDRQQFRDASWPWGLVGRIFNNRGQSGTGALVGDRIVITAGHMVPWGDSPWWMQFVPAYYDGQSLHGAGVQSYVSDARGYDVTGHPTGYDWAVLRLYEPLGTSLGYFGYNGYSDSWNNQPWWDLIGYPNAIANAMRPSFQGSITIGDTDSDSNGGEELESDTADVTPGDSGGPLFGWWGNDPRIVGVVSGEEEMTFLWWTWDKDNIMASGSGFTSLCAWGRTNWPA
jgi:V8-like Glu-specific endopeptidase